MRAQLWFERPANTRVDNLELLALIRSFAISSTFPARGAMCELRLSETREVCWLQITNFRVESLVISLSLRRENYSYKYTRISDSYRKWQASRVCDHWAHCDVMPLTFWALRDKRIPLAAMSTAHSQILQWYSSLPVPPQGCDVRSLTRSYNAHNLYKNKVKKSVNVNE